MHEARGRVVMPMHGKGGGDAHATHGNSLRAPTPPTYAAPFAWWGPVWAPPPAWGLVDLLRREVLSPALAALLCAWVARRRSLTVAAGPRGAGKSTLLAALLAALPPTTPRCYLRGCYESFAFLQDPAYPPARTMLLVNEISAHLPVYLWGAAVARVLATGDRGYAIAATMHAATPIDLVRLLTGYPLRLPAPLVATLGLAVFLAPPAAPGGISRVDGVVRLAPGERQGVMVSPVWERGRGADPDLAALHGITPVITRAELAARADRLARWRDHIGPLAPDVNVAAWPGPE